MYTETDALEFLKDYYDFYNADMRYRKPRVRKISDNVFRISLEECTKKGDFSTDNFFWSSTVMRLTIHQDGKYDITRELH